MSIRKLFQAGIGFFSSSGFHNKGKEYINLMERVQRNIIPMTPNSILEDIFKAILTPEQADFLSKFPTGFVHISEVYRIFQNEGYESEEIVRIVNELREIGFMMELDCFETTFFNFPEMIVGWFEFFWMKDRSLNFDVKKLAKLFDEYMYETFIPSIPVDPENNLTKPIRSLVYDEVLPMDEDDNVVHVLDYETALGVIDQAESISVQHCPCRRMYYENNPEKDSSEYPSETCIAFDHHSKAASKVGLGRLISKEEAKEIIKDVRDHGMGTLVDNMKTPTFMCNCAKDSCIIYRGFHESDQKYMMNKSRFIPKLDQEKCVTCLTCVQRCPLELYEYDEETKKVEFNSELCYGCGICSHFCPTEGALEMIERISMEEYADNINDTYLEFAARFIVENDRLHDMVCFDQQSKFHQMLRPIVKKFGTSEFGKDVITKMINHGAQNWKKHADKKKGKKTHCHTEEKGASFTKSWHDKYCEDDE